MKVMTESLPIYTIENVEWGTTQHCIVKVRTPHGGFMLLEVKVPDDLSDENVADYVKDTVRAIIAQRKGREDATASLKGTRLHFGLAGRGSSGGSDGEPA